MKWKESDGKLVRNVKCQDFAEALELLNEIAAVAEKFNHHPDLKILNYRFLRIEVYTHDTNSITPKDHGLAKEIDIVLKQK
jgi:4a-hydroxytetrahydrobiopterin dehydratase